MKKGMMAMALLFFGVALPASGQQHRAANEDMMKVRQAMAESFTAAVANKDGTAAADHYTADVVIQTLCPESPPIVGREAYAKRLEALLKAGLTYSSKVKEVRLLSDGLAWSTGMYVFTIINKEGKTQEGRGNWIDMLRREGSEWRVSFQARADTPCSP
jgi:uncharacterized protein (TIGR02246 family)